MFQVIYHNINSVVNKGSERKIFEAQHNVRSEERAGAQAGRNIYHARVIYLYLTLKKFTDSVVTITDD